MNLYEICSGELKLVLQVQICKEEIDFVENVPRSSYFSIIKYCLKLAITSLLFTLWGKKIKLFSFTRVQMLR